jgi:hypothetical protein
LGSRKKSTTKQIDEGDNKEGRPGSRQQKRRAASESHPTRRFNDNHVEGAGERLNEGEVDDDEDGGQ